MVVQNHVCSTNQYRFNFTYFDWRDHILLITGNDAFSHATRWTHRSAILSLSYLKETRQQPGFQIEPSTFEMRFHLIKVFRFRWTGRRLQSPFLKLTLWHQYRPLEWLLLVIQMETSGKLAFFKISNRLSSCVFQGGTADVVMLALLAFLNG